MEGAPNNNSIESHEPQVEKIESDDEVFPSERMQKIVNPDMVDGFYTVKGKHAQFQLDAEAYTGLAEGAMTSLEEKQKDDKYVLI